MGSSPIRTKPKPFVSVISQLEAEDVGVVGDQVDHSGHQWTAFKRHMVEGVPGFGGVARIWVEAGTETVEGLCDRLKHGAVPEELPAKSELIRPYVLDFMLRRTWTASPWTELGNAVREWRAKERPDAEDADAAEEEEEDEEEEEEEGDDDDDEED